MILHAVYRPGTQPGRPSIVWLHGFLGSHQEWEPLSSAFQAWPQLLIDLPGHGGSADIRVEDFAALDNLLSSTLDHYDIHHYWLVGYSLGGRVAMYHATRGQASGLQGMVVEGSHPGLSDETGRKARQQGDADWARRFRDEDLTGVLNDWYQQPVFNTLSLSQRKALVLSRSQNSSEGLATMLCATSLSRQPDLLPELKQLAVPFYYLCGERDAKFSALATCLGLNPKFIPEAGHNAHRDAPAVFSRQLLTLFRYSDFKDKS